MATAPMNPWDLSCRPKLGEQTMSGPTNERMHDIKPPVTLVARELRSDGGATGGGGNVAAAASLVRLHQHLTRRAGIKTEYPPPQPITAVHLAAYPTPIGAGRPQSSSATATHANISSYLTSSAASLSSSLSSSPPSSLPTSSLPSSASSSNSSSPSSTRSNSIELGEEIQLVQRVALLREQKPILTKQQQIIDHELFNNNNNESTCISSNTDTSSSANGDSLLLQDRKARKKDQNRRAAYNYRRKKMEEKNRMREEEMRLVYSRVCLIGYVEQLEGSIMYILNKRTRKILDKDGKSIRFLCPVCIQSCDNILKLRSHLNDVHFDEISEASNNSNNDNKNC